MRLPDFYIIGAMKCGTSTLHDQLALRSRFFMSTPKEPNFFSDDAAYERGMDGYLELFSAAGRQQIVGESSTHYSKLPTFEQVVPRIARHTPHARFVYVMRDPLARIVSQYIHEWSMLEVKGTIDEAVSQHERFVAYSCYHRQLEPYLETFGADRILPVFFEKMVADPVRELERVARFLGDPMDEPPIWHEEVARQNVGAERMKHSAAREGFKRSPLGAWLKEILPPSVKESLKSFWRMKGRPRLSSEVEATVRKRVDEDLALLGARLQLSLNCENFKEIARRAEPCFAELATA